LTAENPTEPQREPRAPTVEYRSNGKRRARKLLLLGLVLVGVVWAGFALYARFLGPGVSEDAHGALTYEVARAPLQVTVTADGNVESASNIEVKCRVAGGSTILWIVEDGKLVEEGEEIVKLDTAAIDDKLNAQRITYEKALATQIQAQGDLEAAKISVREYDEGTYVAQLKQFEAEIQIALENLRSAENQLNYSKRMVRKGFVGSLQREADEFAVERAKLDLDAANTKRKVLVDFTRPKTLKDLEAKREAAAAKLGSEQAGLQLEKARLDRLQDQLKNCVITAPKKGMVVYANDGGSGGRFGGSTPQAQVEEGAMVRESQALVRLPDLSRMQVKVTIHESRVDQIHMGLPAHVIIQDQDYNGRVLNIANQPQPGSWYSAKVKEYATVVSIDGETNGLRPGMTAKVTILIANLNDALSVPVSAVVEQRGQFYCWVRTPKGTERRPLKLGRTNDTLIEIADGVKEGEEVLRNPRAVVEEARQEPPFEKQSDDAKFAAIATTDPAAAPAQAPPAPGSAPGAPRTELATETPGAPGAAAPPSPGAGPPGDPSKRAGRGPFDLTQLDKDGDKKLSREELPERMQGMFERLDTNGDGFIDATEIAAMPRRRPGGGDRPAGGERTGAPGPNGAGAGPPGAPGGSP
jgi:HlyD family secretion protein